jgi:hypothetical protein
LVEQQVVILEAVSSSLTIYPYMWHIEKISQPKFYIFLQIQTYLLFLTSFWSKHIYNSTFSIINKPLINVNYLHKHNTNLNYSTQYQYNTFKNAYSCKNVVVNDRQPSQLFPVYTTLLTQTTLLTSQSHPSHKFNFIFNKDSNVATYNLTKLRSKWIDMYHIFHNLFFYQLPILSFTTPLFKNELLSLNWKISNKLHSYWKYVAPSFYSSRNKVMKSEFLLFNYLSKQGFHLAFVFDILYHKNTLFFLHRNNFFTFGLVPLHTSLYTVNFALPISSDNVFIHLFFVRLLIHLQKQTHFTQHNTLSNLWSRVNNV